MDSQTPIKNIRIEDLNELTARNIKRTNFKTAKLVEEISKDMTDAMFQSLEGASVLQTRVNRLTALRSKSIIGELKAETPKRSVF